MNVVATKNLERKISENTQEFHEMRPFMFSNEQLTLFVGHRCISPFFTPFLFRI